MLFLLPALAKKGSDSTSSREKKPSNKAQAEYLWIPGFLRVLPQFPNSPFPPSLSHPQQHSYFPSPWWHTVYLSNRLGEWSQLFQGSACCCFFRCTRSLAKIAISSVKELFWIVFLHPATASHENSHAPIFTFMPLLKWAQMSCEFRSYDEGWINTLYAHRSIIFIWNQPENNPLTEAFKTSTEWTKTVELCTDATAATVCFVFIYDLHY